MMYEPPQSAESFASDLTAALAQARTAATVRNPCLACAWLDASTLPQREFDEVRRAMAGTIGVNTLSAIFRQHGIPVGRRSIERHRAHLRETA